MCVLCGVEAGLSEDGRAEPESGMQTIHQTNKQKEIQDREVKLKQQQCLCLRVSVWCRDRETQRDTETQRHTHMHSHAHARTRTHTRTHARTHAHTHTRTHTPRANTASNQPTPKEEVSERKRKVWIPKKSHAHTLTNTFPCVNVSRLQQFVVLAFSCGSCG